MEMSLKEYLALKWPKQSSGKRFEWRVINNDEPQVYGQGLKHVCIANDEQCAKMICEALNAFD